MTDEGAEIAHQTKAIKEQTRAIKEQTMVIKAAAIILGYRIAGIYDGSGTPLEVVIDEFNGIIEIVKVADKE